MCSYILRADLGSLLDKKKLYMYIHAYTHTYIHMYIHTYILRADLGGLLSSRELRGTVAIVGDGCETLARELVNSGYEGAVVHVMWLQNEVR